MGTGCSVHSKLSTEQVDAVVSSQAALKSCFEELQKQEIDRQKLEAELRSVEQELLDVSGQKDEVIALLADLASQSSANGKAQEGVQRALDDLKVFSLRFPKAPKDLEDERLLDQYFGFDTENVELQLQVIEELRMLLHALVERQGAQSAATVLDLEGEEVRLAIGQHLRSLAPYVAHPDVRVRQAVVEAVTGLGPIDLDVFFRMPFMIQESKMENLREVVVEDAGQNVVHYAALQSHPNALYMLSTAVDWTLDPRALRAKDFALRNVAHLAVERGHMECLEWLVGERKLPRSALMEPDVSGETPHDLAKKHGHQKAMGLLNPVFVTLLSGRECRCSSLDRTVSDLKEEAEQKLGVVIKALIGPDSAALDPKKTLEESGIQPGFTLTAVLAAAGEEEENAGTVLIEGTSEVEEADADHEGVLHDPKHFIEFLVSADIRLVRLEFLMELSAAGQAMPRRQEAETMRTKGGATALVELQEYRRLQVDKDSGHVSLDAGLGGQMVTVHFRSVSHMWESMEHPDPWRHQLSVICEKYHDLLGTGLVWVFIDLMSLYQYRRNPSQETSFQSALHMMHMLYSHEIVQVDILEDLTPESKQVEGSVLAYDEATDSMKLKSISDLRLNPTPHGLRGWCQAKKEWARLRNMLQGTGIPTPPELFRQRMVNMKFTHRNDAENVFQLQAKVFHQKVAGTTHLLLENLTADDVESLHKVLPSYQHLKYVVVNGNALTGREASALIESGAMDIQMESCELTDEDAVMMAEGLIKAVHLKSLRLAGNRIGERGLEALGAVLQQRPELEITMHGQIHCESEAEGDQGPVAGAERRMED